MDDEDRAWCDLCGEKVSDDWFGMEVQRPRARQPESFSMPDCLDVIFCSQEHAARWLAGPLPPISPVDVDERTPLRDHLVLAGIVTLVVVALATFGAGSWAVIEWFRG